MPPGKWDDKSFDRVWELTFGGKDVQWKDLPEGCVAGDSK